MPVAIETSGVSGEQDIELVKEIGQRIAASKTQTTVNHILPTALVASCPAWQRILCAGDTPHSLLTFLPVDILWLLMTGHHLYVFKTFFLLLNSWY
jgi:hypothetical protein